MVKWFDNQTIDIFEQGTYYVNVFAGSCSDKDTIRVFMTENMVLGGPYTLCFREDVTINSGFESGQFTWSNGANTPSITVVEPGTYTLTYNDGMCEYIDEAEVVGSLWVTLYLPNAFTPDDDGINDKFRAYGDGILDPVLRIYDRWGEQLFEGRGLEDAWNGRYNGHRVLQDVYVWVLDYKTVCNGNRSYRDYGHVVVIY
ncbi:MAG: gliding motility-associated C-terminal domain-containing protein [Bacteroidota bacterium]